MTVPLSIFVGLTPGYAGMDEDAPHWPGVPPPPHHWPGGQTPHPPPELELDAVPVLDALEVLDEEAPPLVLDDALVLDEAPPDPELVDEAPVLEEAPPDPELLDEVGDAPP
jgi:hypothetical protein